MHLVLGLHADIFLGANVPAAVVTDPVLDSQNRFYGTAFTLYGVLLWLCASDLVRYASVLRCTLWMLFGGGVARLVSIVFRGLPAAPVLVLLLSEIAGPPLALWWLARVRDKG